MCSVHVEKDSFNASFLSGHLEFKRLEYQHYHNAGRKRKEKKTTMEVGTNLIWLVLLYLRGVDGGSC